MSQNRLKCIAAVAMVLDHIGAELLPQFILLRIIGRLAFPVFSYFVYEGFYHTKDKKKYFARLFLLGMLCLLVYYIYSGEIYGNVLITFSISIILLCGIERVKRYFNGKILDKICGIIVIVGLLIFIRNITTWIYIDYGFTGILLPIFAMLTGEWKIGHERKSYNSLVGFSVGLLILSIQMGGIQYFSLLAIPLLLFYNGKRGKNNFKWLFYWFYPIHLAVIGIISMCIQLS